MERIINQEDFCKIINEIFELDIVWDKDVVNSNTNNIYKYGSIKNQHYQPKVYTIEFNNNVVQFSWIDTNTIVEFEIKSNGEILTPSIIKRIDSEKSIIPIKFETCVSVMNKFHLWVKLNEYRLKIDRPVEDKNLNMRGLETFIRKLSLIGREPQIDLIRNIHNNDVHVKFSFNENSNNFQVFDIVSDGNIKAMSIGYKLNHCDYFSKRNHCKFNEEEYIKHVTKCFELNLKGISFLKNN